MPNADLKSHCFDFQQKGHKSLVDTGFPALSDTMLDPRLFWLPASEAIMIGVLVGAQREHAKNSPNIGIREFVLCSAAAAACGLQHSPALSAVALFTLILLLLAFRFKNNGEESGFTTDLSMLTVFCLSHICALSESENARAAVIGIAVAVTFLLESKDKVRKFFSEGLTREEFSGTLLFLALVFIIYPILPEGNYGPYDGFSPRDIWTFVILVSFVSFGGYFLEKYMGSSSGLKVEAVLGGIASTTATTLSLSKEARENPHKLNIFWQAGTLANAIQFPRLFAFLSAISPQISADAAAPLLAAGAAGILMAFLIPAKEIPQTPNQSEGGPSAETELPADGDADADADAESKHKSLVAKVEAGSEGSAAMAAAKANFAPRKSNSMKISAMQSLTDSEAFKMRNPLTLGPALKCGLVLAIVIFINKVVVAKLGANGLIWTSIIGGLVDVDAIAVSAADLFRGGQIVPDRAVGSVLLAVCMNAVFKTGIAYSSGSPAFASKIAISFSVMLAVAAIVLHFL